MSKQGIKFITTLGKLNMLTTMNFSKKLNESIWEFRTIYNGKAYRLFSFWDKSGGQEKLVVATHGILKENTENTNKRN